MYHSYEDARAVVDDLEQAGIPDSDISLVANADAHGRYGGIVRDEKNTGTGAGVGAVAGGVLGGGAGLLAGIGALAIPGVGPVVAAGWLIATLAGAGIGAASGGLVGSLTSAGLSRDEAQVYSEGVKRGSSLVTVRAEEADAPRVETILGKRGAAGWQDYRASYGADWKGFDATSDGIAPMDTPAGTTLRDSASGYPPGDIPTGRV
jgi:hypothetical protein